VRKLTLRVVGSAVAVAAVVSWNPAAAAAEVGEVPSPGHEVISEDQNGGRMEANVLEPGQTKEQWIAKYGVTLDPTGAGNSAGTVRAFGKEPTLKHPSPGRAGGPCGRDSFWSDGNSTSNYTENSVGWQYVKFHHSSGHFMYRCTRPINAERITPYLKWWVAGTSVSVSVPSGSASFSELDKGVVWAPGFVTNRFETKVRFDAGGVNFSGPAIRDRYFIDYADFIVSGNFYRVQGA
jgi:hypothetical protein